MGLTERLEAAKRAREARALGFEVGAGLPVPDGPDADDSSLEGDPGRRCPNCGADGRIDLVDTLQSVGYLTCTSCGRSWETHNLGSVLRH